MVGTSYLYFDYWPKVCLNLLSAILRKLQRFQEFPIHDIVCDHEKENFCDLLCSLLEIKV